MLRELRGLLNLEYEERRLLTLVLVGLPALASAVADETGLADRVDVPLRLAPLTSEEASRYVIHRIRAAGGNPAIVESGAVAALVKWGTGVPRRLNRLADAALFEAHLAGRVSATAADVERAASELSLSPLTAEPAAAQPAPVVPRRVEAAERAVAAPPQSKRGTAREAASTPCSMATTSRSSSGRSWPSRPGDDRLPQPPHAATSSTNWWGAKLLARARFKNPGGRAGAR